jgi:A/G-specific adenine glycosylase
MLQQTQVSRVVEYFERFVGRFPDVPVLARARLDDVLRLWQGLGYYARARSLHRAAKQLVAEHGGALPGDEKALRGLPGIGRTTAGAILSIGFGQPGVVLDGNVARVLIRLADIEEPWQVVRSSAHLWELASSLLDTGRPSDWNQAMMELGALVCAPRGPLCEECPVNRWCGAFASGNAEELPRRNPSRPRPRYTVAVGVIFRRGRVFITRRPPEGLLGGLWEFPGGKVEEGETIVQALRRELREELGVEVIVNRELDPVSHGYSHFQVELHPFLCSLPDGQEPGTAQPVRWVWPSQLDRYAFPGGTLKIIAQFREDG